MWIFGQLCYKCTKIACRDCKNEAFFMGNMMCLCVFRTRPTVWG